MLIEPVSCQYSIHLNKDEVEVFQKAFPSSRDIEAFVEKIKEPGETISVHDGDAPNRITFRVETESVVFPFQPDVRREIKRIALIIESTLEELKNER